MPSRPVFGGGGVVGEASNIHSAGTLPAITVNLVANADKGRFGGLFKPSWQSKSAEKRLAAVARLDTDDPNDREILRQLACDPDDAVSLAAIQRIEDLATLSRLVAKLATESSQQAARSRFCDLLGGSQMTGEDCGITWLAEMPERAADFAAHAAFEPVRQRALEVVASVHWLAILGDSPHTDTRQWIVQRLTTLDEMLEARRVLRGKDKNAERLLKERIDAVRRAEREQQERLARAEALIEQAGYFSSHDELPNFVPRVSALQADWAAIADQLDAAMRERYASAGKAMLERFEQQRQLEQVAAGQAELLAQLEGAIKQVRRISLEELPGQADAIRSQAASHATEWARLTAQHAPEPEAAARAELLLAAQHSAADFAELAQGADTPAQALRKLAWPKALGSLRAAAQLSEIREAERQAQSAQEQQHQQKLDRIHKQISTVTRLSKAGRLSQAHGLCKSIEADLEQLEDADQPPLRERLEAAREALQKMDDWKNFATEPKYRQLCEAMEKLVDSSKHPDALSGEIKKLQQAWKSLGHSEISEQYWARFKAASDQAYEPCKLHFEQRRETRSSNLEQREPCVTRLRELLEQTNWDESPDYPGIQRQLAEIQREFQAVKDVERAAGAEQWARFKALRDAVQAQLAPEYERNQEAQQRLIGLMQALAAAPPAADSLDKMKALQQRWKQVGITRPRDGRKAWNAFKKLGDQAFENLQSMRQQQRDVQNAALEQRRAVLKSIHELARAADTLADLDHQFAELQQQYEQLPALPNDTPEKLLKSVDGDYRKACSAVDRARERIVAQQRQGQLAALREKAALCQELETPGLNDEARKAIEQRWEQIELSDAELARRIEARRQAASQPRDADAIARQRRLYCMETEISLDLPSPEEDRQLRMQHQLERMNKHGLGHAPAASRSAEALEVDWLCMPGAAPELQQSLDERFRRCIDKARASGGRSG